MSDLPTPLPGDQPKETNRVAARRRAGSPVDTRYFMTTELEDAVAQMPNVRGVRIVAFDNAIDEIHVMSSTDIPPKTLVRNIETLLLVRFGIRVDHRCLSIIQSDTSPVLTLSRPLIQAVRQIKDAADHRIEVELRAAGQVVVGQCALGVNVNEVQGASLALMDAVGKLAGQPRRLDLHQASLLKVREHQVALVTISWHGELADEWFVGAAFAQADPLAAVARATLDAINRKLVRLPLLPEQ